MPVSTEQRDRCEQIRDRARELFQRPDVGACESLAELVEWAFDEFRDTYFGDWNNDEETFVEDFGLVLTERTESGVLTRDEDEDLYLGFGYAGDSCFYSWYQDGSNQVRHFWGYVMVSFQFGRMAGNLASIREFFPLEPPDQKLGVVGARLGAGLDGIGTSLDEVPDWIRTWLCDEENCLATGSSVADENGEEEEEEEGEEEEEEGEG